MPRVIAAFSQFFDDTGAPLVDGHLKFLVSGTNNTLKATYADINEAIPNTNPIQLDGAGRCPNVFGTGSYRVISYTNDPLTDLPALQIENFDPVGGVTGVGAFDDWNAESIYGVTDIVQGSDNNYYSSLSNSNQGNDPTADPINWEQIEFVPYWNTNATYSEDDRVRVVDGTIFVSLADSNQGNNPLTNSDKWKSKSIRAWGITEDYGLAEIVQDTDGALWVSLVADNLGNDPQADDGTNWAPATSPQSIPFTGGGTLLAGQINELQDADTYTLPLANTVPLGGWVLVELPDEFSASEPTVQRAGSDTITDSAGTDTDVLFNSGSVSIRFVSDGVDDWHI